MNDRAALIQEISRLSQEYWERAKSPYLLSAMGPDLKRRGFDFQAIMRPLRLRQFVEYFLDDTLTVIADPSLPLKIGVVPKEATSSKTAAELFRQIPDVTSDEFYRLKPSVFSAFVRSLPQGYRRYLDIKSRNYQYKDLPEGEAVGTDFVEIERNYIVDDFDSAPSKKRDLYRNLEAWMAKNGLKKEELAFGSGETRQGQDILSAVLQRLSDEELARITMPLDIVKKLSRL